MFSTHLRVLLSIDDIEDNSKLRRGLPVAHAVYGVASTINSANLVYFDALRECHELRSQVAETAFTEELIRLHWGQGFEIHWRDHLQCPTESDYKKMVIDKTGGLFRLAIRMMSAFSAEQPPRDYIPLVNDLALYFQIRDDLMNLTASTSLHKSFAEDLTEGKYSFPVIHCILANPSDHRLVNILKQRTEDVDLKRYAIAYLRQAGSFEYTRGVLHEVKRSIEARIAALGGNAAVSHILQVLANTMDEGPAPSAAAHSPVPLKLSHEAEP